MKNKNYYIKTIIIIFSLIILSEVILLIILKENVYTVLKFNNIKYLFFIISIQILTFAITILNSILLSKKNYQLFSIFSSLPLYLRFFFLIIGIFIFKKSINLDIIIFINIFALIISLFILYKLKNINLFKILILKINYNYYYRVFKILWPFFLIYLTLYYLQNIDIIFIRNTFNEEISGKIASAIVIGKIPFFALSLLTYLIFPEAKDLNNKYKFLIIYKSIFKLIIFFLLTTLCYLFFINYLGEEISLILFGERSNGIGQYLLIISLYYIQLLILMFLIFIIMGNNIFKIYIYCSFILITVTTGYILYSDLSIKNIYLILNLLLFSLNVININNVIKFIKKVRK
jgi:O-antigen/teichoic acid export membrane protein